MGDGEVRKAAGQTPHLGLETGHGRGGCHVVGIVYPLQRIAVRFDPAYQKGAARRRARVVAEVQVGDHGTPIVQAKAHRGRDHVNLLT